MRSGRGRRRDEKGATLVEFAFVLPFLALMLFGLIDFGFLFNSNLEVRSASREGARLAAVNGCANNSCPGGYSDQQSALIGTTKDRASGLADKSSVTVRIWCSATCATITNLDNSPYVTVCVNYTFHSVTKLLAPFIDGTVLKSSATMRLEQMPTFSETDPPGSTC